MLRAAPFTLRHVRLGGVRRLCSSSEGGFYYSETEARELFEIWCKKYGKTYPSEEEKLFRFGRFRKTLEWSHRQNQKIDNPEHRIFGTYANADLTDNQFAARGVGYGPRDPFEMLYDPKWN